MNTKIAFDQRKEFCQRLHQALVMSGYSVTATTLAREFNPRADGAAVTVHGARKWLTGGSLPTQERLLVLARWLNVSAQWLRFGDGATEERSAANDSTQLPLGEVRLLNEFRRLDERSQQVVRDLIRSLQKHHSLRT
jgi:hypothetical protein